MNNLNCRGMATMAIISVLYFLNMGFLLGVQCATIGEKEILKPKLSSHNKLVVLSYDGFRFDYMTKTETPTLDKLKAGGVHSPYMNSQFTTKTFPNHQSMATGLHTESHGIMDNQVFDPDYGTVLSGFDTYNERFWNYRPDVAPIWIHNEWAGSERFSGASWPGSNHAYGENKTFPSHYLTYNKSLSFEARMDFVVQWLTDDEKPANLVFMYFDEPDGQGHAFGPESPEVIVQIKRMDTITQYLLDELEKKGIANEVNIIILSDHGFQEVTVKNLVNITEMVDPSLYDKYLGTPLLQIKPKDGQFDIVYEALKNGSEGKNCSVYKKEDLLTEWHFGGSRRVMPIVVLADLGYVFEDYADRAKQLDKKFNLPYDEDRKYGVHGYDNRAESMRSFFLAYGPAFKKGLQINPFDNVDIFPLICKMMDLNPAPNNGTLNTIGSALLATDPSASSTFSPSASSTFSPSAFMQFGIATVVSYVINRT